MKRVLFLLALTPFALFAAESVGDAAQGLAQVAEGKETNYDIIQRSVNFVIFAGILWYLLAEKIKTFFVARSVGIQEELDEVQNMLNESKIKVDEAVSKLEEAKKLSVEIINDANAEVDTIKSKIAIATQNEIAHLNKNFDEKIKVESKLAKKVVVKELLEELLSDNNIGVSQDELANIVLKKVV